MSSTPSTPQIALVTGASRGIGAAIARRFASAGFLVHAGRRNGDKLAPLLGGNITGRSLDARECEDVTAFLAEAEARAPLDLVVSGLGLEQGLNRIFYTPRFLRTMKPKARQMWARFPGLFDVKATDRARSLREFDDAFTAPVHGFKGVMDYWQRASAKPHLRRLALPSLIVNPLNDPFVPLACLPTPSEVNACTSLWQPPQGGHLGFVQGAFPGQLQTWR